MTAFDRPASGRRHELATRERVQPVPRSGPRPPQNHRYRSGAAYVRLLVVSVVVLTLAGACTVETTEGRSPEEAVAWAGFADITGLEITDAEDTGRLDAAVQFSLRGEPAAIDRSLAAAHFAGPFEPGVSPSIQVALSVDLTGLDDIRSAQDTWVNPDGKTEYRNLIRATDGSVDVLHVAAFTI